MPLPTVFDTCVPKTEVLAGELPDAIFAADLWAVVTGNAHQDYLDPNRFFAGTYPTDNLKVLVKDIVERLAGSEGATPIFKLETGFGGGKTHSLIACVHAAKASSQVRSLLQDYRINRFPDLDATRIAAFVGEDSSPLTSSISSSLGSGTLRAIRWTQQRSKKCRSWIAGAVAARCAEAARKCAPDS